MYNKFLEGNMNNNLNKNEGRTKEIKKSTEEEVTNVLYGDTPLYRTYGVKKKYRPRLIKFNNFLAKSMVAFLIFFQLFVVATVGFAFWFYSGELIATVVTIILTTVLYFINTRIPRARHKFVKKLKKVCKEKKYRLEFKRGFWKSLSWADRDEIDFTLKAGKYTYFVRYATATKTLSTMTFLSKSELVYTKHPRNNKFTLIFDFKDKKKLMPISFPSYIDNDDKYSIKTILINPVPMNIEKKGSLGEGMEPTGTGERLFGYTVFNGTGFIETIQRNAERN
jgi:hypothetical protein